MQPNLHKVHLDKVQAEHLENVKGANILISAKAQSRSLLLLGRRFNLFDPNGDQGRFSVTNFAVACRFNGQQWTFSHDGAEPRILSDIEHEAVFRDVCEAILFPFVEEDNEAQT